jgi:hypothetical protein
MVSKLNSASKVIETLSKPLNTLNDVVNISSKTLQTLNTAINVAQLAIPLLPTSPPGTPNASGIALTALTKIKDLTPPISNKINTAKNQINSITSAIDYVNSILSQIISLLNVIDVYLLKCKGATADPTSTDEAKKLTPLSPYLLNVEKNANKVAADPNKNEIYQGFLLEIVEEPFSPTVNKRKAVAKNSNGIILLQTPSSFTTDTQVLLTELKLIIDKNNLKAN